MIKLKDVDFDEDYRLNKIDSRIVAKSSDDELATLETADLAAEYKETGTNLYARKFKIITLDFESFVEFLAKEIRIAQKDEDYIQIIYLDYYRCMIKFSYDSENGIIHLVNNSYHDVKINAVVHGNKNIIDALNSIITAFNENKTPVIEWHYSAGREIRSTSVSLINDTPLKDIYYPYLGKPVAQYMDEYNNSNESVLILLGEPGTGKTSFIRNFIDRYNYDAIITYDENVMMQDSFLIDFMTDSDKNLLIIEDADILIGSRKDDGNKVMSKLLNVSDGLIKIPTKKIIFSTNLKDPNQIDEALTRKGRCFGVQRFRTLTPKEARIVAEDANRPFDNSKLEYTLADIFNGSTVVEKKKFGFV